MIRYNPKGLTSAEVEKHLPEALAAGCRTLVTENPAEYEVLKAVCPEGYRVISAEEMILENMR